MEKEYDGRKSKRGLLFQMDTRLGNTCLFSGAGLLHPEITTTNIPV